MSAGDAAGPSRTDDVAVSQDEARPPDAGSEAGMYSVERMLNSLLQAMLRAYSHQHVFLYRCWMLVWESQGD